MKEYSNREIKNIIDKYFLSYDIVNLKKFLSDNDLFDIDIVDHLFYEMFNHSAREFLELFNDEGKVICEHKKYMFNPIIMDYFCTVDPTIRTKYSLLENQLFDYYHNNSSLSSKDLRKSMRFIGLCLYYIMNNKSMKLEDVFDGKNLKKEFYDHLIEMSFSYGEDEIPNGIKKLFTSFELTLIKNQHEFENNNLIRELLTVLKREDLEKYLKITGLFRKKCEVILSDDLIPIVIFNNSLKLCFFSQYEDEEVLKKHFSTYLNPLELSYFLLFDDKLDKYFSKKMYTKDDLNKIMYLSEDKLFFKPEYISKYISENIGKKEDNYIEILNLLHFLGFYFNDEDKDSVILENSDIKIVNLVRLAKIYRNIMKLPNSDNVIYIHIDNIMNNTSFLTMDTNKLDRYEDMLLYLCKKISESNSPELKQLGGDILYQMLNNDDSFDYKDALDKIEDVFSKNNLPIVGKKFYIYYTLHKDFGEADLSDDKIISPTLKEIDKSKRFEVIFSDLMRCTLGSNNISMRKYLENIYYGNQLYSKLVDKSISLEKLSSKDKEVLNEFLNHLCSLYNNTKEGKEKPFTLTGDLVVDLNTLIPLFKPTSRYSLPDRIVRMYAYSAGFKSFESAYDYMHKSVTEADRRGRELAKHSFSLEEGDMVKGIGNSKYLFDILQNGSLCKEFLGPFMSSDSTPLDTDLSLITKKKGSISKTMEGTIANGFGDIFFVIKKGKIPMTRKKARGDTEFITTGPECFVTLEEGHVGVRTGFATSDIDYIIVDHNINNLDEIKFCVALNGIYIPIVDKKTEKLLFTPEEYDSIRAKMGGLSYYYVDEYKLSSNLSVPVDYDNQELINDAKNKRECINKTVEKVVNDSFGYRFKTYLSSDISVGGVELIDTGSTGRGTNVGKTSDFDFVMRVDESANREEIARSLCEGFGISYDEAVSKNMVINCNNLRLKDIRIDGVDDLVDIDITFISKADQVTYTTDMAISDRLETIKKNYPEQYEDVLDNIIYAKNYLKECGAYKPSHAKDSQGGLGGVGIENWILQNGGSFFDACQDFYRVASENGEMIPFEKFCEKYKIFDFGENYYNGRHDEFVSNNMTAEGYKKMFNAVKKYLNSNKSTYHYDSSSRDMSYGNVETVKKVR